MSDTKISIKVGHVEFSGEGNEKWLSEQLDKILVKVPELLRIEISETKTAASNTQIPTNKQKNSHSNVSYDGLNLSITNIASKLSVKSGADLVLAAGCFLKFVDQKPAFTREDILKTIKAATGYYKENMSKNLSTILLGLVKNGSLNQTSTSGYALNVQKENSLYSTIAG